MSAINVALVKAQSDMLGSVCLVIEALETMTLQDSQAS